MQAKWISILATAVSLYLFFLPLSGEAQWSVSGEYNILFPTGSYGDAFKTGSNFNVEGKYHFNKGWGMGFQTGASRFANAKEGLIAILNPKLFIVPLVFTAEYEASLGRTIRPFFAAGLGLSIFTFSYYENHPVLSTSETNTSFTMSPQIGIRFFMSKNTISYLKLSYVLGMDSPPAVSAPNLPVIIYPVPDNAPGYAGIALGLSYRFNP